MLKNILYRLAKNLGGTIEEVGALPDGRGFALMSMPLPKDHWSCVNPEDSNIPPMPFRMGNDDQIVIHNPRLRSPGPTLTRQQFADKIREAGRYAYRGATMIDQRRKKNLRNALANVLDDKQMANIEENLRMENVPLCGKPAYMLPFYSSLLHRGCITALALGTSESEWAAFNYLNNNWNGFRLYNKLYRQPGFHDSTNTNPETMLAAMHESVQLRRKSKDDSNRSRRCINFWQWCLYNRASSS